MHKPAFLRTLIAVCALLLSCSKRDTPVEAPPEKYTGIGGHINPVLTVNGSPYRVTSTLVVDASSTLDIEAGVRMYFEDSTQITVDGRLSCMGNATNQILLSSKNVSWKGI